MTKYSPNITLYDETGKITFDSQKLQAEKDELVEMVGWLAGCLAAASYQVQDTDKVLIQKILDRWKELLNKTKRGAE